MGTYSRDSDFERYEKRALELSVTGEWRKKHDMAAEDIDLRLKAKGIDPAYVTLAGKEQLRKASVYRALYHVFDEVASMGSEIHTKRRDDYEKKFDEEFELQITVGIDTDTDTGAAHASRTVLLVR
jgi:hypothetical protein